VELCSIVVSGGSGTRIGGSVPKQLHRIGAHRILDWSVLAVARVCARVVVVAPEGLVDDHRPAVELTIPVEVVTGGPTRSASVRAGLSALERRHPTHVLIHDAARPAVPAAVVDRVVARLADGAAAVVPVIPVTDSLRYVEGGSVDRDALCAVQTPQGFTFELIRKAHRGDADASDDASLVDAMGVPVVHVEGDPHNVKVTVASDVALAGILLG
jgi:2-C-methyl-D-erythritol 4-phosphate cytidylyltransferase